LEDFLEVLMEEKEHKEFYSLSDADAQQTYVGVRRAKEWVGFFLPHLQQGYDVLDCGCGVGSITLDLAELVAPGKVIGVDLDETQLQVARSSAVKRGLTNVSFEQGNIYELRFNPASFDAALAHTLLYHLSDPLRAMKELRRVLKPGGVLAISDDDFSTMRFSPDSPIAHKLVDVMAKVVLFNGGSPFYSPHLRSYLLQAGFARTEGFAVAADHYGKLEETRRCAYIVSRLLSDPTLSNLVVSQGWSTRDGIDEMIAWIKDWGERPDAFMAVMYCAALGWNE
jgi:ubiquinone/menaquinone biosynthesis C-methylase UbiE